MYIDPTLLADQGMQRGHYLPQTKHFQLDASKIKRAQKVLGANRETETIERALDLAITKQKRNRLAWQATEGFLKSDVKIRDVYEVLAD